METGYARRPGNAREATMRAAVFAAPGMIQMARAAVPKPGPGEARIRLEGCGVCASNLPLWEGQPWFEYPLSPGLGGHEGWGVIDALGPSVDGFKVGERVAFLSNNAYAEYDLAAADQMVRLPAALDGEPFPGEALGCALNIHRRAAIEAGQTVAVVGCGFLGVLLTGLAAQAGARVLAISRRLFALELAARFGAERTLQLEDARETVEQVMALTEGRGCEQVIEATGKQGPLTLAAELTRERGRLIVAGYHQDGARQVNMQLWNWRGLDVINAHEREPRVYVEGLRAAAQAVAEGRLDPAPLYTHRLPLGRLDEAFRLLSERPDGFMKAMVMML